MHILYLASTFFLIFIFFYIYQQGITNKDDHVQKKKKVINNRKIILTITSYLDFDKENKWDALCTAIDSILYYHPNVNFLVDIYVINEYVPIPKEDWSEKIKQKYPFVNFIQKTKELKGQGESLNLILDIIKTYTYWIHWEEAWYCIRPFIFDAVQIMDSTKITQLQFTKELDGTEFGHTHWKEKIDINNCHRMPRDNNYCILKYNIEDYPKIDIDKEFTYDNWMTIKWPLYSIRPSINRVKDYNFGKFLINPEYWPLKFEIDFGQRWMKRNYIKAIFAEGCVTRRQTHISTYK
jgi:hypothetical protein